jgi:hypothetical protein
MLNLLFFFITLSHGRYLVCIIWNSKSVQLIFFKLCTVFIYILKMFTCYYTPTNKDWGYKGITSICLSVHPDFVSRHYQCIKMHTLLECFAATQVQTRYWSCYEFNFMVRCTRCNWNIVESGIKHQNHNPSPNVLMIRWTDLNRSINMHQCNIVFILQ